MRVQSGKKLLEGECITSPLPPLQIFLNDRVVSLEVILAFLPVLMPLNSILHYTKRPARRGKICISLIAGHGARPGAELYKNITVNESL